MTPDEFAKDLQDLSFRFVQQRASTGVRQYSLETSPYLTYWVHWDPGDESVLFTWEFAIGEFMAQRGLQVCSDEQLNSFMFPKNDAKGPADTSFVVQEMDRAEAILRGINFLDDA